MSIVAIGEVSQLGGYALAGVDVVEATSAEDARAAWDGLPTDVELVLLTSGARAALGPRLGEGPVLWVEVPE